ncbi:MAG TPA: hypothetical protein PKA37_10975 [Planctomycetota bacterium]|jgi:hypothetical protein|nr:hypothetical protein [Planctomycetota bacterium]
MPNFDARNLVIMLLLGLLGVAVGASWQQARSTPSGGGGDSSRDLIAVTGHYSTGSTALYVLDTRTYHMAVYRVENGKALELIAARDISFDLKLESYGDQSPPSLQPARLRATWEKWVKTGAVEPSATGKTVRPEERAGGEPRGPSVINLNEGVTNTPPPK